MEASAEPLVGEASDGERYAERRGTDEEESYDGPSYTASHFTVLVKPVALTMVLAACVCGAMTPLSGHISTLMARVEQSLGRGVSAYTVYGENVHDSSTEKFGKAVVNALVIVSGVIVMTFLMVLLYKFRCLKCLYGLLVFTTLNALSYTLGFILYLALLEYNVTMDWVTFSILIYNFGIVGVVAVFYQKGIPRRVTQAYLIVISVVISYLLSFFPEIELAQTRRDPLPALLYEANLGDGTRSGRRQFPTALTGGRRGDTADARDRSGCSGQGAGTGTAAAAAVPGGAQPTMELQSVHPGEMGSSAAAAPAPAPGRLSGSDDHAGAASGSADGAWSSDVEEEEEGGGEWTAEESDGEAGAAGGGRGMAHRGRGGEEDMEFQYMEEEDTEGADDASIKLGLGDFIFYSLLVSKAALFSFSTAVTCFIVILMGLMTTLTFLAISQKALPALPFSMFLGVFFYVMVRLFMGDFNDHVTLGAVYY